jgi:hypothetical protein
VTPPYSIRPHGISSAGTMEPLFRYVAESGSTGKFLGTAAFIIHPNTSFEFALIRRTFTDQQINEGNLDLMAGIAAEGWQLRQWRYAAHVVELLTVARWTAFGPA